MALRRSRKVESGCALALAGALIIAGCAVGPNYQRPSIHPPETIRGQIGAAEAASLADLPWWQVFEDPVLQRLVEEAVRENHDLKTAISRIEQYHQLIGVARADLLPQIQYEGQATRQRAFLFPGAPNETFNVFLGDFNLAWEIDIWGRIRRATESARADYFRAQAYRRGVLLTLVSEVAQAYFDLLELDRERQIARLMAKTFRNTLDLFTRKYEGGVGSLLEVSRGDAALGDAEMKIPDVERAIVAKENQLSVLLGRNPGSIPRGAPLEAQAIPAVVSAGLPANLLERRPDLVQAEEAVVAANADVGVAVGNFFPRVGLRTLFGGESSEIENVAKGAGKIWEIAGSLTGPIFQGGRLVSNYRAAQAAWEQTVQQYVATAIGAFGEVSSALVSYEKLKAIRRVSERTVKALQQSVDLSLERYNQGVSTYFEVLEAQQQLFPAELDLARTTRDQLTVVVLLYRALGGGWNLDVERWAASGVPATPLGGFTP